MKKMLSFSAVSLLTITGCVSTGNGDMTDSSSTHHSSPSTHFTSVQNDAVHQIDNAVVFPPHKGSTHSDEGEIGNSMYLTNVTTGNHSTPKTPADIAKEYVVSNDTTMATTTQSVLAAHIDVNNPMVLKSPAETLSATGNKGNDFWVNAQASTPSVMSTPPTLLQDLKEVSVFNDGTKKVEVYKTGVWTYQSFARVYDGSKYGFVNIGKPSPYDPTKTAATVTYTGIATGVLKDGVNKQVISDFTGTVTTGIPTPTLDITFKNKYLLNQDIKDSYKEANVKVPSSNKLKVLAVTGMKWDKAKKNFNGGSDGHNGTYVARFYGDNGEEIGGTFTTTPFDDGKVYTGAFAGEK